MVDLSLVVRLKSKDVSFTRDVAAAKKEVLALNRAWLKLLKSAEKQPRFHTGALGGAGFGGAGFGGNGYGNGYGGGPLGPGVGGGAPRRRRPRRTDGDGVDGGDRPPREPRPYRPRARRPIDPGEQQDRWGSRVHHTGLAMERAAYRTGSVLTALVGPTIEYQRSIIDAVAVTGDAVANPANEQRLRDLSRQYAALGYSANDVAKGIGYMGMAGMNTNKIIGSMLPTLKLARAGSLDLARTTDLGTDIMTAFALKAGSTDEAMASMTRVADVMAYTFTSANTTLSLASMSLFKVGALAPQVGLSLESVAGAVGSLGSAGIKGSEAGTSIRNILLRLSNPKKPAMEILGKLRLKPRELTDRLKNDDLTGMLNRLNQAFDEKGWTGAKRTKAIDTLFGNRTTTAASYLLEQARNGTLGTQIANTRASAGTVDAIAGKKTNSVTGRVDILKARMQEVGLTLGEKVLPELLPVAEGFLEIAESFAKFSKENPGFVRGMVKGLLAFTAVNATVGPMVTSMGSMIRAGALLQTSLGGTPGAGGGGVAGALGGVNGQAVAATGGLGKLGSALGKAGLLGAVFAAAYGIGTAADQLFGLSDKLSGSNKDERTATEKLARANLGTFTAEEGAALKGADAEIRQAKERLDAFNKRKEENKSTKDNFTQGSLGKKVEAEYHQAVVDAERNKKAIESKAVLRMATEKDLIQSVQEPLREKAKAIEEYNAMALDAEAKAERARRRGKKKEAAKQLRNAEFFKGRAGDTEVEAATIAAKTGALRERAKDPNRRFHVDSVGIRNADGKLIGNQNLSAPRKDWRSLLKVEVDVKNGTASVSQDGREIGQGEGLSIPGMGP